MQTKTIDLFELEELQPHEQEIAHECYLKTLEYTSPQFYGDTLQALSQPFPFLKVNELDTTNGRVEFVFDPLDEDEESEPITKEHFYTKCKYDGACRFTGTYTDLVIEETIDERDPKTMKELYETLEIAINNLAKEAQEETQYEETFEAFKDFCEANELLFHSDGRLFIS